jgi:hypothetical protein
MLAFGDNGGAPPPPIEARNQGIAGARRAFDHPHLMAWRSVFAAGCSARKLDLVFWAGAVRVCIRVSGFGGSGR